jgi:sugar phosphate isomerase/epimerase
VAGLRVGISSLGFLHHRTLAGALESAAESGYRLVDVSPTAPHLYLPGFGHYERRSLARLLEKLGLACVSVNPYDLNLISSNLEYADLSRRHLGLCLELAHDPGAPYVVFSPGRLFGLNPEPLEDAVSALLAQLERLLPDAERLGVGLCVETVPFGFMRTGREVAGVVDHFSSPWVRAAYDVANTFATETAAEGVGALGDRLAVAHLSGAWRGRWAHAGITEVDIDFADFAIQFEAIGFKGPTVYALIDGVDPGLRIRGDLELLETWGWSA